MMISMVISGDGKGFQGCLFAQARAAAAFWALVGAIICGEIVLFILYHYNYVEIALLKNFTAF